MYENGFIINEENRQHVSLSNYAMDIIESDIIRFTGDYEIKNRSGFMNTIIENYYEDFPLSRNVALKQVNAIKVAANKAKNTNKDFSQKITEKIIEEFSDEIMKTLIQEYADKYPSDRQFKIKLNQSNADSLNSYEDAQYFHDYSPRSGASFFVKIILETYSRLKKNERERIYFKKTLEEIDDALKYKRYLKYKTEEDFKKVWVLGYINQDDNKDLKVLLGETDENSVAVDEIKIKTLKEGKAYCMKEKVRNPFPEKFFVKDEYGETYETFSEMIIGHHNKKTHAEKQEVIIKFSDNGLNRFLFEEDEIKIIGIAKSEDENTYTFNATELDIYNYFFKYGIDAEIIKPVYLKERFVRMYKRFYEILGEGIIKKSEWKKTN